MTRAADIAKVAGEVGREPRLPDNRTLALWYAMNGVPVFPVHPETKTPRMGSHGLYDATTHLGDVARAWSGPRKGWAVAIPGGHGVICLDEDRCGDVQAALGRLPEGCLVIDTPSACKRERDHACQGRRHYLFAGHARKAESRNLSVEVKGQGAYFLAPWTARSDGRYAVTRWHPEPVEAPLPDSLYRQEEAEGVPCSLPALDSLPRMVAPPDERAWFRLERACEAIAAQDTGSRRPTMYREAYAVGIDVGRGWLDPFDADERLREASDAHPALDRSERHRHVRRGLTAGAASADTPKAVADANRRVTLRDKSSGVTVAKDHAAGKAKPVHFPNKRWPKWDSLDALPAFDGATVRWRGKDYSLGWFWWHAPGRRDRADETRPDPHSDFILAR